MDTSFPRRRIRLIAHDVGAQQDTPSLEGAGGGNQTFLADAGEAIPYFSQVPALVSDGPVAGGAQTPLPVLVPKGGEFFRYLAESQTHYELLGPRGARTLVPRFGGTARFHDEDLGLSPEERLLNVAHFNWLGVLPSGLPALLTTPVLLAWGLRLRRHPRYAHAREEPADSHRSRRMIDVALLQLCLTLVAALVLAGLLTLHL